MQLHLISTHKIPSKDLSSGLMEGATTTVLYIAPHCTTLHFPVRAHNGITPNIRHIRQDKHITKSSDASHSRQLSTEHWHSSHVYVVLLRNGLPRPTQVAEEQAKL